MSKRKKATLDFRNVSPWPYVFSEQCLFQGDQLYLKAIIKACKRFDKICKSREASGAEELLREKTGIFKELSYQYAALNGKFQHAALVLDLVTRSSVEHPKTVEMYAYLHSRIMSDPQSRYDPEEWKLWKEDVEALGPSTSNSVRLQAIDHFNSYVSTLTPPPTSDPDHQAVTKFIESMIRLSDDQKADFCYPRLPVSRLKSYATGEDSFESMFPLDEFAEISASLAKFQIILQKMGEEHARLHQRTIESGQYVREPIQELLEGSNQTEVSKLLLTLGVKRLNYLLEKLFEPIYLGISKNRYLCPTLQSSEENFPEWRAHGITYPLFWYTYLTTLVSAIVGEPNEVHCLSVYELILKAITHPKQIKKMNVERRLDKLKGSLSKYLAPFTVGHHQEIEKVLTAEKLVEMSKEDAFFTISEYLSTLFRDATDLEKIINDLSLRRKIYHIWDNVLDTRVDAILGRLAFDLSDLKFAEYTYDDLEVDYIQGMLPDVEEDQEEDEAIVQYLWDDFKRTEEPLSSGVEKTWLYHHNPNSQQPKFTEIKFSADNEPHVDVLESFFRSHKIKTIVQAKRIYRVISTYEYARRHPEILQESAPMGEYRWTKLPCGDDRVFCRTHEGTTCFHVYPRKIWKGSMTRLKKKNSLQLFQNS